MKLGKSNYIRDVVWQASGNGLAQVVGLIGMPFLTRLYEPNVFAMVSLFNQVVAGLAIFITFRFEYFIQNAHTDEEAYSLLSWIAGVGFFLGLLLTVALKLPIISEAVANQLGHAGLKSWLYLAPITAFLFSISVGMQQIIQRKQKYHISGFSEVLNKIGYISSGVIGGVSSSSLTGLICAMAVGYGAKGFLLFQKLRKNFFLTQFSEGFKAVKKIYKSSLGHALSGLITIMTGTTPLIFIAHMYGGDILGQYNLVVATLYLPSSLIALAIGQVYYQRAAQNHSQGKSFLDLWRATIKNLIFLGVPLYFVIAILSPWAYPLIFGSNWVMAGEIASVMTLSSVLSFITSPLDRTCLVVGVWWYAPVWHLLRALTTIGVISVSSFLNFSFTEFLWVLNLQIAVMYFIDGYANFCFAKFAD